MRVGKSCKCFLTFLLSISLPCIRKDPETTFPYCLLRCGPLPAPPLSPEPLLTTSTTRSPLCPGSRFLKGYRPFQVEVLVLTPLLPLCLESPTPFRPPADTLRRRYITLRAVVSLRHSETPFSLRRFRLSGTCPTPDTIRLETPRRRGRG